MKQLNLFSHLHVNASLRFLTCPPDFSNQESYTDEADTFYLDPAKWLVTHASVNPPNYLVLFDELLDRVSTYLSVQNYVAVGNFFHCDVAQGRVSQRVLVFARK